MHLCRAINCCLTYLLIQHIFEHFICAPHHKDGKMTQTPRKGQSPKRHKLLRHEARDSKCHERVEDQNAMGIHSRKSLIIGTWIHGLTEQIL